MSPFWTLLELRIMEVVVTTGAVRRAKFYYAAASINKCTGNLLQHGFGCPVTS